MSTLDITQLLRPISAESACGNNMEYDPAFLELERLCQVKPEQQMGSTIVPAQEPEWKEVQERCEALFTKTKDLRVAFWLLRALLNTSGFAGLAQGVSLIEGLVREYWDTLYPLLDPEDDHDPTIRVNLLNGLNDTQNFIDKVRSLPIVNARSFGRFSFRDVNLAQGELAPAQGTFAPKIGAIDGAFSECTVAEVQEIVAAVQKARLGLSTIESFISEKVGNDRAPSFSKIDSLLNSLEKLLTSRMAKRGITMNTPSPSPGGEAENPGEKTATDASSPFSDEVTNPSDVIRLLDKICEYYKRNEPSSPVPILLQRSKRLVSASFLDILLDLAPSAMPQIEVIRGKDPEKSS